MSDVSSVECVSGVRMVYEYREVYKINKREAGREGEFL